MNYLFSVLRIVVLMALTAEVQAQGPKAELERNRALWESHGFSYYSFIVSKACFCSLPSDARIIIADDRIFDVVDPLSGEPAVMRGGEAVMPRFVDDYETIEELFDLIEAEIDAKGDGMTGKPGWIPGISAVLYDERYGFPTAFSIDHSRHLGADGTEGFITDSMIEYRLRGFLAVPPER